MILSCATWVVSEIHPAKQHQNERRQSEINLICGSSPADCGGEQPMDAVFRVRNASRVAKETLFLRICY